MLVDIYYITFPKLQAVRSWGDHPLLKRSAMNQNEFAKGDRDKGIPSVKGESYYIYLCHLDEAFYFVSKSRTTSASCSTVHGHECVTKTVICLLY